MKKGVYTEFEAEDFLKKYVPVARHVLARSEKEAEHAAQTLGFPLVLKIISKKLVHKSDVHGVRLAKTKADLKEEYHDLLKIAARNKLHLEGILIQEYVRGESVLLGLKKDMVFGHVFAFGIGGIYTELLKDMSFRICPITDKDAEEMIEELHMKPLLFGYRGKKKIDIEFLKKIMIAVSKIPVKNPDIQEMDINPFVINDKKGAVVDARIVV